ncbi:MAG: MBL fold metallo-hydrolase [Cytophagaceae bacterium]|nr:MBL fold metallo-hydrolase [Gemmatimonadaceae bacterium]
MRIAFPALLLTTLLGRAALAPAQPVSLVPPNIVARDTGATMQRLAEGVYVIVHEPATNEWPHGNTGVIVGENGVLIIDSNYLPARAVDDIALIRQVTNKPVRYLVNTHWHGDHTHGNGVYRDSFPGLAIFGTRESAPFIELNLKKLPTGALAANSYSRTTLAALEASLARGRDSAGRAWTAEERTEMAVSIGQRKFELTELAKVKVAAPDQVFEGTFTLEMGGGRRVEFRNMGPANSVSDVIIYLPADRVLFAGDILVYPSPYTSGSFFMPWIGVLEALQRYSVAALVPGHGPVMANHDYTRNVHDAFASIRTQLDSMYRLGMVPPDAAKKVDLKALRNRFWVPAGRPIREAFWEEWTRSVSERMSLCVMGYSC